MLSSETLERYRRMSPEERLRLTLDLSRSAWKALCEGPEEIVKRRFLRLQIENELRNISVCEALERAFPSSKAIDNTSENSDV